MSRDGSFEIFLVAVPGLEKALWTEARAAGFKSAQYVPGGVTMKGHWPDVWRANLEIRGASKVLVRLASFRAAQLEQLEPKARAVRWRGALSRDVPFRVEATCRRSRIYHSGAAAERVERAIRAEVRAPVSDEAEVVVKVRIEDDVVTIAVDTSGEGLHKRGSKEAVGKAPMRETMASLLLRQCGFAGAEPVIDPMCGSGTFVIEAAEIAAGFAPGRARRFAFETLATFDPAAWQQLREAAAARAIQPAVRFHGRDRDAGAIRMSEANAARAGVTGWTEFREGELDVLTPPEGPAGLVIVNPPYGDRIGDLSGVRPLYRALGQALKARFKGWRLGLITSDAALAEATGLRLEAPFEPVLHGGLRVMLYRSATLG